MRFLSHCFDVASPGHVAGDNVSEQFEAFNNIYPSTVNVKNVSTGHIHWTRRMKGYLVETYKILKGFNRLDVGTTM